MVPALETSASSVGNYFVAERFLSCVLEVQEGQALSDTLQRTGLVPKLAIAMVRVGESTGALAEMLTNTSEFFDDEIEFTLNRIVTLIEPAILIFMGLVVTGLLLAVYYPLLLAGKPDELSEGRAQMAPDPSLEDTLVLLNAAVAPEESEDFAKGEQLARRLGLRFDPLNEFQVDPDLFRTIPVEIMLRYDFLPLREVEGVLEIVMADPSDVVQLDELESVVGRPLDVLVGPGGRINEILEKSESTQRVLDEATEGFRLQIVQEAEDGEEVLSIDRITADSSPIIRLVDSILFNAIQRRASDIHIETRSREVVVKYRIDGVLYQAMESIDRRHHSTIISRIKVMSELDIAEKRVPQDGRFKVRFADRTIDFRVSIMPTVHGEDAVIRILDKESANAEFRNLSLDVLRL